MDSEEVGKTKKCDFCKHWSSGTYWGRFGAGNYYFSLKLISKCTCIYNLGEQSLML